MADKSKSEKSLDSAPAQPPEFQTRKGIADMTASRDAEQGGPMPGMGGPNDIGQKAMAAEQALGALAQAMPDPAPIADIIARLRAAVISAIQSSSPPPQQGAGLAGIVAPPAPVSPPAMGGMGMPAPPLQ